jgi:hypothetical protein
MQQSLDAEMATKVTDAVEAVNKALADLDVAIHRAEKIGLRVETSYAETATPDLHMRGWGAKRFSAMIERREFIRGIQG